MSLPRALLRSAAWLAAPFAALIAAGAASAADPAPATPAEAEVQYILDFVRSSNCTFIRNGTDYTSPQAADHLTMKAKHVGARIKDGDTLIDMIASRSSMSGQPYYVQCPGRQRTESSTWLHGELDRYRATLPHVAGKP